MRKGSGPLPLSDHGAILHALEAGTAPMGLADILHALGFPLSLKAQLRAVLHEMALAGTLATLPPGRLKAITGLPEMVRVTVAHLRSDGCAYAHQSHTPDTSILLVSGLSDGTFLLPGDEVLVRLRPCTARNRLREGRPIRLLSRQIKSFPAHLTACCLQDDTTCLATFESCDGRIDLSITVTVPQDNAFFTALKPGVIALLDAAPPQAGKNAPFAMTRILGNCDAPGMAATLSILTHTLPENFTPESEAQAHLASQRPAALETAGRRDLRDLPLVTIDDETAQDFDDAIWAEETAEGFHLVIAIADVSHYVPEGSVLDQEARIRGNSVYLPGHVLPMLPESLSAGACSLKPHEDRLCVYVDLTLNADGQCVSGHLGRALMRSAARLTYRQVQAELDGHDDAAFSLAKLPPALLSTLAKAAAALRQEAVSRGERSENTHAPDAYSIEFDQVGYPVAFTPRPQGLAEDIVARFMIAANRFVADFMRQNSVQGMFRGHAAPKAGQQGRRVPAYYSPVAALHHGLALPAYAHFTSPIRRYADLVTHRAVIATLESTSLPYPSEDDTAAESGLQKMQILHALAGHLHFTERRAASATLACQNRLAALFLRPLCGHAMTAYVTGTTRSAVTLTLTKTGTPSLLFRSALPDDSGLYDDSHTTHAPQRSEATLQPGCMLSVVLRATNPARGTLTLAADSHAR
ncbi:RNB domain-containing ribonuclease [Acetobacter cibinongensis]|uniref:RNB domain-containing ribonuclease n=1 Tax=Acetobacter cibinongensis TaxID=146475 RepID=UPI000A38EFB4|nr:ribonuclease R family protein [Acetobacter cibinongensis]